MTQTTREAFYTCEHCGADIRDGDMACIDSEGIALCEAHSPMLSDVIRGWQEDMAGAEPYWPELFDTEDELKAVIEKWQNEIAATGDSKFVSKV